MDAVADAIDELYRVPPEDFVAERDARVAAARENGDPEAAKAIAALRRPTRAAWLTNLLVRDRPDDVDGLLALADTLASAQRSLDGAALREVSAQRSRLVRALSRRAAALGREAGARVDGGLERDVAGVLESALADRELAGRVRSGRLVRAERHAGFGPEPAPDIEPHPAGRAPAPDPGALGSAGHRDAGHGSGDTDGGAGRGTGRPTGRAASAGLDRPGTASAAGPDSAGHDPTDQGSADRNRTDRDRADRDQADRERADRDRTDQNRADQDRADQDRADQDRADQDRAERERRTREQRERERAVARAEEALERAERVAGEARDRHGRAAAEAADATDRQTRARDRIAELTDALDRARAESAEANRAAHAAARAESEAARAARSADTARDRAAAALEDARSS